MTNKKNSLLSLVTPPVSLINVDEFWSENMLSKAAFSVLLHNGDAHNVNVTGRVCYLT